MVAQQKSKLRSLETVQYIDECVICDLDDITKCTLQPHSFVELARHLDIPLDEILDVGDNPVNDIESALNADMLAGGLNIMDNRWDDIQWVNYELSSLRDIISLDK